MKLVACLASWIYQQGNSVVSGCRGVEGTLRFPSPSLSPHSGISIPRLTNMSATQDIKLGNFTSKSCGGHKRIVSKFVMHLQTDSFLNQSPFLTFSLQSPSLKKKAHLSYSAMCMLRESTVFRGTQRLSLKWFSLSLALAIEACLINLRLLYNLFVCSDALGELSRLSR